MRENIGAEVRRRGGEPSLAEWADAFDDWRSAWDACPRCDWLLWIAQQLGAPDALLFEAAVRSSVATLHDLPPGVVDAFERALERWRDGSAERAEVLRAVERCSDAMNTGGNPLRIMINFPDGTQRQVTPEDLTDADMRAQVLAGVEAHSLERGARVVRDVIRFSSLGAALN